MWRLISTPGTDKSMAALSQTRAAMLWSVKQKYDPSKSLRFKLKLSRNGTFRTNYSSADSRTDHQITGNGRDFSWSGSNEQQ